MLTYYAQHISTLALKMLYNINCKVKDNIPISDTETVQLIISLNFSPKGHEKEIYDGV